MVSRTAVAVAVLAALGCGSTRNGVLERVGGGAPIPMTLSLTSDVATLTGTDPATGEVLTGRFRIEEASREGRDRDLVARPAGGGPGTVAGGVAAGTRTAAPSLDYQGDIEGDKGTRLRCVLQLRRSLVARGEGMCRDLKEGSEAIVRLRF